MNTKSITYCPCCGAEISAVVAEALKAVSAKGGRAKTEAKTASSRANMLKAAAAANAAYTPEKRKAAAQKRLATLAAKKQAKQ